MENNNAEQLVSLIRELVREELNKRDSTSIGMVKSVNNDNTVNICLFPDFNTIISNIKNSSKSELKENDIVVLYKINNQINNSFIISKY